MERSKEPHKLDAKVDVVYTAAYERAPEVIMAEEIVAAAFRGWVLGSGIGVRRAKELTLTPVEPRPRPLVGWERRLMLHEASRAIADTYGRDIPSPDKIRTAY